MQFSLPKTLEILSATPNVMEAFLGGLSEDWTGGGSREDFSPYDVVGHLINCEYTDWMPRVRAILGEGDKHFPPFDRYAHFEASQGKTLRDLLDEFAAARRDNLTTLRSLNLDENHFALTGIHPELGPVTLRQLLSTWTVHDLTHTRQIATNIALRYKDAVGPWIEHLSILR